MIASAKTVRDKALISTLYESNCRINQLSGLKLNHIKQCPDGFVITVKQMGHSRLLLTVSAPYLSLWLNEHPGRGNKNAPLWCIKGKRPTSLSNAEICKILQNVANRAGVQKCISSHNSRQLYSAYQVNHSSRGQINNLSDGQRLQAKV